MFYIICKNDADYYVLTHENASKEAAIKYMRTISPGREPKLLVDLKTAPQLGKEEVTTIMESVAKSEAAERALAKRARYYKRGKDRSPGLNLRFFRALMKRRKITPLWMRIVCSNYLKQYFPGTYEAELDPFKEPAPTFCARH